MVIKKSKFATFYFLVFIFCIGLQKCNALLYQLTGFSFANTIGFSFLNIAMICLFLSYNYGETNSFKSLFNHNSKIVNTILIYVHFLLFYGIYLGNNFDYILAEYWTALLIFLSYKISLREDIWALFEGGLKYIFMIYAALILIGTNYTMSHLEIEGFDAIYRGVSTGTMAYDMSILMDFWPFLFLLAFFRKDKKVIFWTYAPLLIYILFEIYFIKRAPTIRAITYFILASFLQLRLINESNSFYKRSLLIIISIIAITLFIPDTLYEKFQNNDTSRQDEAINMITQLSFPELLFGKGLGGDYIVPYDGIYQNINKDGKPVNSILHIGFFYPILKGGIFLFGLIFYQIVTTITQYIKRIKISTNRELTCFVFLIVYSTFRLIEGPISPGAVFDGLLFGISLGYLEKSRKKFNIYDKG